MNKRVLIIEDDPAIADGLAYALEREGYDVEVARDGEAGLSAGRARMPDVVLLDLMLPGVSGWAVCRALRRESAVPILMLTARGEEEDRVRGLEIGADDYVTKPFSTREVVARINAVLRRTAPEGAGDEVLEGAGVSLDVARHEVSVDGVSVSLSPKEWNLLEVLLRNKGRVLTRDVLLERVWGEDVYMDRGTLDVHIRWIRQKIERDPAQPERLLTVRGVGYKFAG
jgi:two-component system response regulator RegX3